MADDDLDNRGRVWPWLAGSLLVIAIVAVLGFTLNRRDAKRTSAKPPGRVESIIFCESIEKHPDGSMNFRGVFNEASVDAFPAKFSFVVVYTVRTNEPGHKYEFKFAHPQGMTMSHEFKVADGPRATVKTIEVPDMPIAQPSAFLFGIFCDGQLLAERSVNVRLKPTTMPATTQAG